MGKSKYIFAVASIRAREKNLLSDQDVQTMAGMKDSKAVVSYLTERGWGTNADSNDAESVLSTEEEKVDRILQDLGVDPFVVDVLSYRDQFHNLKAAVKVVCTGVDDPNAFYENKTLPPNELVIAVRDGDFDKLPSYMRKAAKEAKDILLSTRDGQRCDVIIDRACLDAMENAADSSDPFIRDYAESMVAVTNIKVAVRACRTKRSYSTIVAALAPCRSFDTGELARAAALNIDAVYEYLTRKGFAAAVDAIKESFSAFERWCDNQTMEMILPEKHVIDSSGPVVAFYLARKNEIQMARIIITAKDNGFPDSAISERVRKMYG